MTSLYPQLTEDEIKRKKRQIRISQISFDADVKRNHQKQEELEVEMSRNQREINRFQVMLDEQRREMKKLKADEVFLEDKLRHLKKELINLGT